MKAAAVTMVWRDLSFLKLWTSYYSAAFGRENLYVILHGSDPQAKEIVPGCNIIEIPRAPITNKFDLKRWNLMAAISAMILETHDVVVCGDVDELVFADPNVNKSLQDLLLENVGTAHAFNTFGVEIVQSPDEGMLDPDQSIFSQRKHLFVNSMYCKPSVIYEPVRWSPGGHASNKPVKFLDGLSLTHLRFVCEQLSEDSLNERAQIVNQSLEAGKLSANEMRNWKVGKKRLKVMQDLAKSHKLQGWDAAVPKLQNQFEKQVEPYIGGLRMPRRHDTISGRINFLETPSRFHEVI